MPKRVFFALPLPDDFQKRLSLAVQEIKSKFPNWRWLSELTWHLTILPPHYWNDQEISLVASTLEKNLRISSFKIIPEKIILGPPSKQKRMVWLLFKNNAEFVQLKLKVVELISKSGIKLDSSRQKEITHLTLARFPEINQESTFWQDRDFSFALEAKEIQLWQVFLDSKGAIYQKLETFKLM